VGRAVLSFLFSHFWLSGIALAAVVAFVGVGLLGGWPLVLNRRVVGALVVLLACVAVGMWRVHDIEHWRKVGAEECARQVAAVNDAAKAARRAAISEQVVESSARETDLRAQLRAALSRATPPDPTTPTKQRATHVTRKADAGCVITAGFVRDHNANLPGAAGRATPPDATPADPDAPSGVALSQVVEVVAANYASCAAVIDAQEQRRYESCVAWDKRYGTNSGCTR
jgi:hypothetical protein